MPRNWSWALGATVVLSACTPQNEPAEETPIFEDARGALPADQSTGLLSGTIPLEWGFVDGEWRAGWVLGDSREQENLAPPWISEVYVFCRDSEFDACPLEAPRRGDNVFATVPKDAAYSPYWQVVRVRVPDDYVDSSLKSEQLIIESGWETERLPMVVNCPIHAPGASLEDGLSVANNLGWYEGYTVEYWDFGLVEMDEGIVPAQAGYSLFRDGEELSEVAQGQDVNMDGDASDTNRIIAWGSADASALVELTRADVSPDAVTALDLEDASQADYTNVSSLDDPGVAMGETLGLLNFGLQP